VVPEPNLHDEPEFVRRSRRRNRPAAPPHPHGRRLAVLLLALAAQGVTTFRNVLAARFPQLKPALTAACACCAASVELPAQIDDPERRTPANCNRWAATPSRSTTLLRNQSAWRRPGRTSN
jgi:hypothetical protein